MPRIFVSGHGGMVGSAILRALASSGKEWQVVTKSRADLDLCNQGAVRFYPQRKAGVHNAAEMGNLPTTLIRGVHPRKPVDQRQLDPFGMEAWRCPLSEFGKFLHLSQRCGTALEGRMLAQWPAGADQLAYALAKIAGLEMAGTTGLNTEFFSPGHADQPLWSGDNYHPDNSHVCLP